MGTLTRRTGATTKASTGVVNAGGCGVTCTVVVPWQGRIVVVVDVSGP